ncbi:hypothetical protein [Halorarum salinum]|uniref:Uncharacterized protein n=1 Tax=Halorarum salinum TaxID=2743089 RepID=A0A7D5LBN2_9EURY|nr:hypothetical protein [Halobaculum salinum]QLG63046.1 hypothetical protein HUG12_15420 [Halobaculum salinum]
MASIQSDSDRVDAAVEAALDALEEGDRPLVASDWAVREHDVDHRYEDVLERVQEHVREEGGNG